MIKKWGLLTILPALLLLSSCGKDNVDGELLAENIQLHLDKAVLQMENENLQKQIDTLTASYVDSERPESASTSGSQSSTTGNVVSVKVGDLLSLDFAEITIDRIGWSNDIKPSNTSGSYRYIKEVEGQSFLVMSGLIKNISGEVYDIENTAVKFVFNEKYTYSGTLSGESVEKDSLSLFGLNPLGETRFYVYTQVPNELKEVCESGVINFGFNENFGGAFYDGIDSMQYIYQLKFAT